MDFLHYPLILSPMAGGPSTPELCAAVSNSGGLGMLAAGYLTPATLNDHIHNVESHTDKPYGINIFSPPSHSSITTDAHAQWQTYRDSLAANADFHEDLPQEPVLNDDFYKEKLAIALKSRAKVISFTFGYPDENTCNDLHRHGKKIIFHATTPEEIRYTSTRSCDYICLQGNEAGGHRATVLSSPDDGISYSAHELLDYAHTVTKKPLIVAGGISTTEDILSFLSCRATAVQVGSLFLLADEAGTKETHRHAIKHLSHRGTLFTKAFTGRYARAIRNTFTDRYSVLAPDLFPEIYYLTAGIRTSANKNNNPENLNLWAGSGVSGAGNTPQELPASTIIKALFPKNFTLSARKG